jgi:hypothetical protein
MGDLKKKMDYIAKADDGLDVIIETEEISSKEEHTMKLLKSYMQKFYDMQVEKEEKKGDD